MKKYIVLLLICIAIVRPCLALHISGGELYYNYIGPGAAANTDNYQITLRLFRECTPVTPTGQTAAPMPTEVELGIFINNAGGGTLLQPVIVTRTAYNVIQLQSPVTCITNPPQVCYQIGYFTMAIDLPKQPYGYTIAYQTCCRSFSIQNIEFFLIPGQNTPGEGATYSCTIPGTNILGNTEVNSSAVFAVKDTVLVCQQKKITLDFSATDPDTKNPQYQDSLSYSFCEAYDRGAAQGSGDVVPSPPPYNSVTYSGNYSGDAPLGPQVVINPVTGIITGYIGASGGYVVNVCVTEWRHGKVIGVHRKDFLLRVAACDFAAADLKPSYITCNGYSLSFQNESTSSAITSYYWNFGVKGANNDTSINPTPTFNYADTGTYVVKLVVNKGQQCSDSTTTLAKVYPGFKANFGVVGNCLQIPYQFIDSSVSKYGVITSWLWNFGDNSNTSTAQNTTHQYTAPASVTVSLTVNNSEGCTDTYTKPLVVSDKPTIYLPFTDTLICNVDTLRLVASTSAPSNFTWSPGYNIINAATANPLVYPQTKTTYTVLSDDGHGCTNTSSVTVDVATQVNIHLGNDTTICAGDTTQIIDNTNALYFAWQPANGLSYPSAMQPLASPTNTTTYTVLASISKKCTATANITIRTAPYPVAKAAPDTSICFGKTVQLKGSGNGSSFVWSPTNSLFNANTLIPIAGPQATTIYKLAVYDTLGCPKPGLAYATVQVSPPVTAFAGHDTTIVVNQPLQLTATGGTAYTWSPSIGLNNTGIPNPVAVLHGSEGDSILYAVKVTNAGGCTGYAHITVRVFNTQPQIFVPSAFTPNSDSKNDVLKPIVAGMRVFNYFKIFNRWGNQLFSSGDPQAGWDGNFAGKPQQSGTYIYIAQAVDYLGNIYNKKGTVVLVR